MEELQPELNTEQTTETVVETKTETRLSDFLRLEDMLKSEKEVKQNTEIKGLEKASGETLAEDRTFARKKDEKKVYIKRRLKIVTGVYVAVVSLLLAFAGVNVATLATQGGNSHTNDIAITQLTGEVENASEDINEEMLNQGVAPFTVSLNEPRDYSDDNKELSFLDKVTILFRNIFG